MSNQVKTTCNQCGTTITLDFSGCTHDQALQHVQKMDNLPRECPGYHVEIGGWRKRWNLDDALRTAFPESYNS